MPTFDHTRRDTLELLTHACAALQRIDHGGDAERVREIRNQLLDGRLTTAVVGEFKTGKSSLVGALVEDPELFPVNVDIATNLVTSVEYGVEEQITAYVDEDASVAPHAITRAEIADYVTEQGNARNGRRVQLLRVRTPNPRLTAGLVLLDTPGAGGLNSDHTAVTYGVLASAHVVIFVVDALTPLTTEELALLRNINGFGARLLIAVTKVDIVTDVEARIANARGKLQSALSAEVAARTPVIAVSSAAKLDWLQNRDPESLRVSNFEQLDSALWGLLAEHGGAMLINQALGGVIRVLDDVVQPLHAELAALTQQGGEIRSTRNPLNDQRDHLASLDQPDAGWRTNVVEAFNRVRDTVDGRLTNRLDEIWVRTEQQLQAPDVADRAQAVLAGLERDVTLAWSALVRDVRLDIARVSDQVEAMTGLKTSPVMDAGGALVAFESFGRKAPAAESSSRSGAETLGWIGEILGYLTGNVPVFVVSQVLSFFGTRSTKQKKRRADFVADVDDQMARVRRELSLALATLVDSAEKSVASNYDALILAGHGRVDDVSRALTSTSGDPQRIERVRDTIAELTGLSSEAHRIVGRSAGSNLELVASEQ